MNHKRKMLVSCAVLMAFSLPVLAGPRERRHAPGCTSVQGKFSEYVITPFGSPNDPFGRVVLESKGTINAVGTAILTSVGPGDEPGTFAATTRHVFLVSVEDQLEAEGAAVFTPIPGTPDVYDVLTLTVTGGTGKFAGASGEIVATGVGYNFFPLPPGPSSANQSYFDFRLSGQLCGVAKQDD
ncbi:MAG: hypothetical protein WAO20_23235 [Acidobacteriota bacterium]